MGDSGTKNHCRGMMKIPRYPSLLVALALTLTACSDGGATTTTLAMTTSTVLSETTAVPESTVVPDQDRRLVSFADLSTGECFNAHDVDVMQTAFDVTVDAVNCNWAHEAEVYASYVFTEVTGFPGDEARDTVDEYCDSEFVEFVGNPIDYSSLFIRSVLPTQEDWDGGIQIAVCVLVGSSGDDLRGSALQQGW